jgi:hypothetical protein
LRQKQKITSFRLQQQVQQQGRQRVQLQRQEQQQVQVQQQGLQQQVQEEFLFYRKRPKQQPIKLPREVILSWGFLKNRFERFREVPHALV